MADDEQFVTLPRHCEDTSKRDPDRSTRYMAGNEEPMLNVVLFALLTLTGCTGTDAGQRPEPKAVSADSPKYALAAGIEFAELEIPQDSRGGVQPPGEIILKGPWSNAGTNPKGMRKFEMPVPIRSRALFFHRAQSEDSRRR